MSTPLVSVGILVYKSRPYLEALFASMERQTLHGVEILVGDNSDDSDEDRRWIEEHYPHVRVEVFGNVGFAKGHNRLAAMASGKYYLCLNPDVILEPEYVQKIVEVMESDGWMASAQGSIFRFPQDLSVPRSGTSPLGRGEPLLIVDSLGLSMKPWGQVVNIAEGDEMKNEKVKMKKWVNDVWGVSGAAAVYRKNVFLKLGGFDERMFMYKEDVDLAYRLRRAGYKAICVSAAVCFHDRTADVRGRKGRSLQERRWSYWNHRLFLKKIWADLVWWKKVLVLGYEGLKWGYVVVFERDVLMGCSYATAHSADPHRLLRRSAPPRERGRRNDAVKLSICIVHYRQEKYLERFLESILLFPPSCEYEVIVVDNSEKIKDEKDKSKDLMWLESFKVLEEKFRNPGNLRFVISDRNRGFGHGLNLAALVATGEYVLLCNCDLEVMEGALDSLLRYADEHSDCGLVGPQLVLGDGTVQDSYRRFPRFLDPLWKRMRMKSAGRYVMEDKDPNVTESVDWIVGAMMMLRKDFFEEIGSMDERFFLFLEDTDLCRRVWKARKQVVFLAEAKVLHADKRLSDRGSFLRNLFRRTFWIHVESAFKYFWKWGIRN